MYPFSSSKKQRRYFSLHPTDHQFSSLHNINYKMLNDNDIGGNKGVDVYHGVANPTASSNHSDPLAANFVRPINHTSTYIQRCCLTNLRHL